MNDYYLRKTYADGRYVLPPLPFSDTQLEPLVCAETLFLHHDKHHAAYVAGANSAMETLRLVNEGTLSAEHAVAATQNLAFHLGGHILHTLYWENLSAATGGEPGPAVAAAIEENFGGYRTFCKLFDSVTVSVQGSGWGVLGVEPVSRRLVLSAIRNHQDALVPGFFPLLVCDVWEHAYYLTWSNNRKGYVQAFMNHINWNVVENRMERALRNEY